MKTVVLYKSRTGNTQRYAEDIARRVNGEVYPLKKGWLKKIEDADCIVFGGYVQAGIIAGLDDFLSEFERFSDVPILIFAVGMAYPTKEGRQDLITGNLLDMYHVRFYQVQGGFDLNKLGLFNRLMMKRTLSAMAGKEDATAAERSLGDLLNRPLAVYDHEKIDKIVSVINTLSLEAKA